MARNVVQLVEYLPTMHYTSGFLLTITDMIAHSYNPRTQEVKASRATVFFYYIISLRPTWVI